MKLGGGSMKKRVSLSLCLSWLIILITGFILVIQWNSVDSMIGIHIHLLGEMDQLGNKYFLLVLFAVEIIINLLFTFHYDLQINHELKKIVIHSKWVHVLIQFILLLIMSIYIIAFCL